MWEKFTFETLKIPSDVLTLTDKELKPRQTPDMFDFYHQLLFRCKKTTVTHAKVTALPRAGEARGSNVTDRYVTETQTELSSYQNHQI